MNKDIPKYFILVVFLLSFAIVVSSQTREPTASRLTDAQGKEARELLLLVDVMDFRLTRVWNADNDFGAPTEQDRSYTNGARNAAGVLAKVLDKLPRGDYKLYLMGAAIAYVDVGRIRLLAFEDDGDESQRKIMEKYKLENTEGHLRAWKILTVARASRNLAARKLGIPVRNFSEEK